MTFESQLQGRVTLTQQAGFRGVHDVSVAYTMAGGAVTGSTLTDEDGYFTIHINTGLITSETAELSLTFFKASGEVLHEFSLNDVTLHGGEHTMLLDHLNFGHEIAIVDLTSVPFAGVVFMDGMYVLPDDTSSDLCPSVDASVCVYNADTDDVLGCDVVDGTGAYSVPVASGLSVYALAQADMGSNHTFELHTATTTRNITTEVQLDMATGENVLRFTTAVNMDDENAVLRLDFRDTTKRPVDVQVAGGRCNHTLGTTTILFQYTPCLTWELQLDTPAYETRLEMPAALLTAELVQVRDANGDPLDQVPTMFENVGGRLLEVDLRNPAEDETQGEAEGAEVSHVVRYEYHPPPSFTISYSSAQASPTCSETVLTMHDEPTVTVAVEEQFWDTIPACTWVEGTVQVTNQLGEASERAAQLEEVGDITPAQAELLSLCYSGCDLDLELDTEDDQTYENARVSFKIRIGEPKLPESDDNDVTVNADYRKDFSVSMTHYGWVMAEAFHHDVVVTGDTAGLNLFGETMTLPEYWPLLVLYDPPGGASYASYVGGTVDVRVTHKKHDVFGGYKGHLAAGADAEIDTEGCTPFSCTDLSILRLKSKSMIGFDSEGGIAAGTKSDNYANSYEATLTYSLSTSSEGRLGLKGEGPGARACAR